MRDKVPRDRPTGTDIKLSLCPSVKNCHYDNKRKILGSGDAVRREVSK